jgi:hypothetical protein
LLQLKLGYQLNTDESNNEHNPYSKSKFGRDAEIVISLYMMSKGWGVTMSRGSRGPADLYAKKDSELWCVQVKASTKVPQIKGMTVIRLIDHALAEHGRPVLAILQPSLKLHPFEKSLNYKLPMQEGNLALVDSYDRTESFYFSFYDFPSWRQLIP